MDKNEVQDMIDQSIVRAIKNHEFRVGWISGIVGSAFVFGIMHSIWLMRGWIQF
jgi:hypothetical protein